MSPDPPVVAVDIGGTKMAVGIVDGSGALSARRSMPTPREADAETVWEVLAGLVATAVSEARTPPAAVGVGCGGPMSGGGTRVSPLNIPGWREFPLAGRLEHLTALPTAVDNDAKALALAEGWLGAAAGTPDFVALVVSTGVGGGVVSGGRLLDGRDGNAGHIGHVIVEPDGPICACGGRGCLEAMASGLSIERMTGRPAPDADEGVRRQTGRLVGRAVAGVANLLDLRLAVVAGSVALGFGAPFFEAAQAELDASARLAFSVGARIVPAGLGSDGPLIGAGAVALRAAGRLPGLR